MNSCDNKMNCQHIKYIKSLLNIIEHSEIKEKSHLVVHIIIICQQCKRLANNPKFVETMIKKASELQQVLLKYTNIDVIDIVCCKKTRSGQTY